jgi:ring-1,2-phenylacetyl-CoA epoxidase subunit PaaD
VSPVVSPVVSTVVSTVVSNLSARAAAARRALDDVVDPEIPVLTIADLGVLRDVTVAEDGRVEVTVTPTYSGCPAMDVIRADVVRVLTARGFPDVCVRTVLAPAWSTDDISPEGRRKLAAFGIAPPGPRPEPGPVLMALRPRGEPVRCPRCGSGDTRLSSRFGSTACKALYVCAGCAEPFDHVKAL